MLRKIKDKIKEMGKELSVGIEEFLDNKYGTQDMVELFGDVTLPMMAQNPLRLYEAILDREWESYLSELFKDNYHITIPLILISAAKTMYDIKRVRDGKSTVLNSFFSHINKNSKNGLR